MSDLGRVLSSQCTHMLGDPRQVLLPVSASRSSFQNRDSTYLDSQGYTEEKHPGSSKAVSDCDLWVPVQGATLLPSFPYPISVHPVPQIFFSEAERRIQAAGGGLVFGVLCCCHA